MRIRRQRQVWFIPLVYEREGGQVKPFDNTCHIWALFQWTSFTKGCCINVSMYDLCGTISVGLISAPYFDRILDIFPRAIATGLLPLPDSCPHWPVFSLRQLLAEGSLVRCFRHFSGVHVVCVSCVCLLHCPSCSSVDNKFVPTNHVWLQFLILYFFDAAGNWTVGYMWQCTHWLLATELY